MHQLCMLNESLTHNNSLDLARSAQMQQTVCDQRLADPFVKRQQWPVYRFSAYSTKWENSCRECMIIREYEVMRVLAMSLREMERYHPRVCVLFVSRVCVCLSPAVAKSECVSLLSPVKTRFTYGLTIVAIAQGSFAWRQICRRY